MFHIFSVPLPHREVHSKRLKNTTYILFNVLFPFLNTRGQIRKWGLGATRFVFLIDLGTELIIVT